MTRSSLRYRLLSAAAISVSLALVIAGFALVALFERHVERRMDAELATYLAQISGHIGLSNDGRIQFGSGLTDPRFRRPLSGLYWQIQDYSRPTLLRSRSLWDTVIELPDVELAPGIVHRHAVQGPAGHTLMVRERQIIFRPESAARRLRIAVAMDRSELIAARNSFATDMLPYLGVLALALMLAAWVQVRIGLTPLDAVRRGVSAVRAGDNSRLRAAVPEEVTPLVGEVNALLDAQEQTIERARAWTADLAHGLKTPLTALSADAQRLREQGSAAIADDLEQLAETMRRRVDRELIRARMRTGVRAQGLRADTGDTIARIVRTLKRTPQGSAVNWDIQVPEHTFAAIQPDDLTELMGNLLENAAEWAEHKVAVKTATDDRVHILIEDDGLGVSNDQLENLCERGVRLDQGKQGSGLGLAIARDITEAYHGELSFGRATLGGLAVTVRLPRSGSTAATI